MLSGTGGAGRAADNSGGRCRTGRRRRRRRDWCGTLVQVGSDVSNLPICIIKLTSGTDNVVVDLEAHDLGEVNKNSR